MAKTYDPENDMNDDLSLLEMMAGRFEKVDGFPEAAAYNVLKRAADARDIPVSELYKSLGTVIEDEEKRIKDKHLIRFYTWHNCESPQRERCQNCVQVVPLIICTQIIFAEFQAG